MEIKEFMFVVTTHHPLTSEAIEEHYYNNSDEARVCFNELCEVYPLAVVEFGIYTLCNDTNDDSYKVIKTRF